MKRPKRQIAIDLMTDHQKQCYIISIEKYADYLEADNKILNSIERKYQK